MTSDFVKKFVSNENLQTFSVEKLSENGLFNIPEGRSYSVAHLAFIFFKQKKYSQAQIIYEGLICANPFDPSYHVILGLIYYETQQKDLALTQFTEAVELDPDCYAADVARAYLMLEKQHNEDEIGPMGVI